MSTSRAADKSRLTDFCHCLSNDIPCSGSVRWDVKTEATHTPATSIYKVTPNAISHWPDLAPDPVTHTYKTNAPRAKYELKWYEVTGKVVLIRAEDDGDFHIQIQNQRGTNGSVNVVVEIPAGEPWCSVRSNAFTLIDKQPPFNATGDIIPLVRTDAVIRVVGHAFYDGQHANMNHQPNRRRDGGIDRNVTIWEIHPVMDLQIIK